MSKINSSMYTSNTDEWATPQELFDQLNNEFCFDLDPCSTDENCKCEKHYTKDEDGLIQDWSGRRVFCNPPFSDMRKWVEKCYREGCKDNTLVVMLMPARTDTKYFHDFVLNRSEIRFCEKRLRFGNSNNVAPFPVLIVIFRGAYI